MRLNKKADLAISTNAIVVLIIAVIMLGLIIAFVTNGFGAVTDNFLSAAKNIPDPEAPSSGKPLTVNENIFAEKNGPVRMKMSIYNGGETPYTDKPTVTCDGGFDPQMNVQAPNIPSRGSATIVGLGKAGSAEGIYLCQAKATIDGSAYSADFFLEVKS